MMRINRRGLIAGGAALAMTPRFASAAQSGFSPTGLKQITGSLKPFVEKEEAVGLVTLLYRKGEVAQVNALGWRDREAKSPMARDSIFRIASMTKPTVAVATLMLMEEGKFRLTDPVAKWLPELANVKVLRTSGGPIEDTVPPSRQITVVDLLTHRSGLGYAFTTTGALAKKLEPLDDHTLATTSDAWMKDLGALPLVTDVGAQFQYGLSFDVLGVLIERVSGMPFQDFMRTRVYDPLGMADTAFYVPKEKEGRVAALYSFTADGKRAPKAQKLWTSPPPFASGGGGLYATADDYLKFAKLLLGKGKSGDVRLLSRKSVELMTTNWLTPEQRKIPFSGLDFWAGQGFGLGVAVIDDIARYSALGTASKGAFYWPGLYGTWWAADPAEDMIMIYMVQNDPGARGLGAWQAFQSGAYRAIDT
jgi:CubicO group peptidase (beta-lactamase class C family)